MIYFQNYGHSVTELSSDADRIRAEEARLLEAFNRVSSERPESVLARIRARGRLTAEDRVRALCDCGSKIWFLDELMGYPESDDPKQPHAWRLGVICAVGRICDRQAVIVANDNTVAAGSWWPGSPEKIQKAQKLALRLGIPVFYLVECAGLYLPHQELTFASETGAGRIFEMQAQLGKAGILQVAAVFGDCVAGGGYMPLLCDKIVMTEQAAICIGGTALNAQSKGGSDQKLGGPDIHVHQSGCVDERVPDDMAAIRRLREWAQMMPTSAADFFRKDDPVESPFDREDLYHLIPADLSRPLEMYEILARLVDGAQFQPLIEDFGQEIVSVLALVDGLPVVMIANQAKPTFDENGGLHAGSILYQDGITKMRVIASAARDDGIPVVWIQDVAGFDIGPDAERRGLLRHGAMLLRELASDDGDTPASLTVLLRKASGAGYYAMKGAPFNPAWIVGTVLTRLEVMKPEVLAGILFDKKLAALDDSEKSARIRIELEEKKRSMVENQLRNGFCMAAAMRGDIDDIVPLNQLRDLMVTFVRSVYQSPGKNRKPERLWSILQLEARE